MIRFGFLLGFLLLSVACTGAPSVVSILTLTPAPVPEVFSEVSGNPLPTAMAEPEVVLSTPVPSATPVPTLVVSTPWPTMVPWPTAVLLQPVLPTVSPFSTAADVAPLPTPVHHRVVGSVIVSDRVADLMDEGVGFSDLGQYDEAIAKFEEAEMEHGEPLYEARTRIGVSYFLLLDYNLAIYHFTRAIEAGDYITARVSRATVYRYVNMCPESVQDALAALEMEPFVLLNYHSDVDAYMSLAICFARSENYALSLEHADMGLVLAREHGFIDEGISEISAVKVAVESIARGDSYVEDSLSYSAHGDAWLGNFYFDEGLFPEAIQAYESAQEQNWTPSGRLYRRLAESYSELGDYESALRYSSLRLAVRDDGPGRYKRAFYYFALDDCEHGLVDAEAALGHPPRVKPGSHSIVDAHFIRGVCRARAGQFDDAAVDFDEWLRLAVKVGYSHDLVSGLEEFARKLLGAWDPPPLTELNPLDCDIVLRQQLVFQEGATDASWINQMIDRVREQNVDSCPLEIWNPRADDGNFVNVNVEDRSGVSPAVNAPTASQLLGEGCWLADVWSADDSGVVLDSSNDATGSDAYVGATLVPAGLRNDNSLNGTVRSSSGRDSENNVIIYWSEDTFERPSDNARCWLYVRSTRTWDETY